MSGRWGRAVVAEFEGENPCWVSYCRLVIEFTLSPCPPSIRRIGICTAILFMQLKAEANILVIGGTKDLRHLGWCFKRWPPDVRILDNRESMKSRWVKILGLPYHLWTRGIFTAIRGLCRGLV